MFFCKLTGECHNSKNCLLYKNHEAKKIVVPVKHETETERIDSMIQFKEF